MDTRSPTHPEQVAVVDRPSASPFLRGLAWGALATLPIHALIVALCRSFL